MTISSRLSKIIVSRFRGAEYFMRSAQFYAIAIFVTGRLCPPASRGGFYALPKTMFDLFLKTVGFVSAVVSFF